MCMDVCRVLFVCGRAVMSVPVLLYMGRERVQVCVLFRVLARVYVCAWAERVFGDVCVCVCVRPRRSAHCITVCLTMATECV